MWNLSYLYMIMEKLQLINYRCFKHLDLRFKNQVNLFIGDNSSGKSTIIQALKSVLNSFFIGFSDENTVFSGLSKADFTITENDFGITNERPINVDFKFLGLEASLQLNSKKSRTLQKPLDPIYKYAKTRYHSMFDTEDQQVISLPVFGSFSTKDIHITRGISSKKFTTYAQKPSFGYYECLQGDGFLNLWTKRLLVLKEADRGQVEIEGVTKAVLDALGPDGCNIFSDISIRPNQGEVYFIFKDSREINVDGLSDGYRRLVNIVLDVAFRCMILNQGIFGKEACYKSRGTVLIDEIDLHLHPSLQALVIQGFQKAFPLIQLIATTHAPLVMSGVPDDENNIVYKLTYHKEEDYKASEIDLYGLDASTIMQVALKTVPRNKDVDRKLNELFAFIDNNEFKNAVVILNEMREDFGDRLPELSKAETMLNFFSDDNDLDQ